VNLETAVDEPRIARISQIKKEIPMEMCWRSNYQESHGIEFQKFLSIRAIREIRGYNCRFQVE
jgi:hypothetical protein